MDGTLVGHVLIAALNLATALVAYWSGRRNGRNGRK